MEIDNINKIDCVKCTHFLVTWEPKQPKGCKLFGFKSACLPSIIVYESTGSPCGGFEKKKLKNSIN